MHFEAIKHFLSIAPDIFIVRCSTMGISTSATVGVTRVQDVTVVISNFHVHAPPLLPSWACSFREFVYIWPAWCLSTIHIAITCCRGTVAVVVRRCASINTHVNWTNVQFRYCRSFQCWWWYTCAVATVHTARPRRREGGLFWRGCNCTEKLALWLPAWFFQTSTARLLRREIPRLEWVGI